jgi:radical SAM superfamily enzyme YgiQ (UPF0313 family)
MEVPKICLISIYGDQQPRDAEPTAILSLRSALVASFPSLDVQLLTVSEDTFHNNLKRLKRILKQPGLLWAGVSIPQGTFSLAKDLIRHLNEIAPSLPLVLGHAVPTSGPREVLDVFPEATIVSGWGDDAARALTSLALKTGGWSAKDLSKIPNASFLCDGSFHEGKPAAPTGRAPMARTLVHPYPFFPRVEASRGCSYGRCTFCSRPESCSPSGSWIPFPVDQVLEEVRALSQAGIRRFTFADEDFFGSDPKRSYQLLNGLESMGTVRFSLSARLDDFFFNDQAERRVVDETIGRLKRAGMSLLFIGLESLSGSQLQRYRKGYGLRRALHAIRYLTEEHRIPLEFGFILFDPFTTVAELRENLRNLRTLKIARMIGQPCNHLRVRRGTPYVDHLKEASLLRHYDVDEAEYGYAFECPKVEAAWTECRVWKDALDAEYLRIRNIKRTIFRHAQVDEILADYRDTELDLLEIWIGAAESGDFQEGARQCRRLTARVRERINALDACAVVELSTNP